MYNSVYIKEMKRLKLFLLLLIISVSVSGITITSQNSGNWNVASTWSPAQIPTSGDDVIIANGHTVTINANGQACKTMTVNTGGTLRFSGNSASNLFTVNGDFIINGT